MIVGARGGFFESMSWLSSSVAPWVAQAARTGCPRGRPSQLLPAPKEPAPSTPWVLQGSRRRDPKRIWSISCSTGVDNTSFDWGFSSTPGDEGPYVAS